MDSNISKFDSLCNTILKENMMAGGVGAVTSHGSNPADSGGTGGSFGNVDSYNPGDSRYAYGVGSKPKKKKKKKKTKKKGKKKVSENITALGTGNTVSMINTRPRVARM